MAADIRFAVQNPSSPTWLPPPQDLVQKCKEHGHGPSSFGIPGPGGPNAAFVKYGPCLAMGEARTQNYLACVVKADEVVVVRIPQVYYAFRHGLGHGRIGYIVMEYVGYADCDENDFDAIVRAVERLLRIPNPTAAPGPIGGGIIMHRFFLSHLSSVQYNSVEDLQSHINNASDGHCSSYRLFT